MLVFAPLRLYLVACQRSIYLSALTSDSHTFEPQRLAGPAFVFLDFAVLSRHCFAEHPERFSTGSHCLPVMGLDGFSFEKLLNLHTLSALHAVFSVHWQKNTGKRFDVMPQRELFESTIAGGTFDNILKQPLRGPSRNHQKNIQNIFIRYAFNADSSRFLR